MSRPPLTIWEHAQMQGLLPARLPPVLQLDRRRGRHRRVGRAAGGRGARHEAAPAGRLVPLPGMHLLQRVVHPVAPPDRLGHHPGQDLPRLHRDAAGGRRPPGRSGAEDHDGEVQGPVPDARRGVGARRRRRRLLLHRRPHGRSTSSRKRAAGAKAVDLLGQLRVERLHPGREARIRRAHAHRGGHLRHADHQGAGLPARSPKSWPASSSTYLAFDRIPQLDGLGRPKAFYSRRVHDTCYRRPNYDAGLFVEAFDDENARRGYCLYKMGCRGPVTYNACGVIRWNNGRQLPHPVGPRLHRLQRGALLGQRPVLPAPGQLPGLRHRDHRRHRRRGRRRGHGGRASPRTPSARTSASGRLIAEEIRDSEQIPDEGKQGRRGDGKGDRHGQSCCHRPHHPDRGAPARRSRGEGRQGRRRLQLRDDGARLRDHPEGARPARRVGVHRAGVRRVHDGARAGVGADRRRRAGHHACRPTPS